MGQNPFWLQGAFLCFWMGYNRVVILPVVWMCFRWLGFLLPNCGAEGQKPSGNPSQCALKGREFRRKGVINGLGLCPTTSSPEPLSSVKGAWQCSLRKAVHCGHRHGLNLTEKGTLTDRVSALFAGPASSRGLKYHRKPKRWKCSQSTLGLVPEDPISLPKHHVCHDVEGHPLFLFSVCHLLLLAFSITQRRDPTVSVAGTWKGFYGVPIYPRRTLHRQRREG